MLNNQPTSGATARDLRIDFFRGLALYMILVDHVIGDPLGRFTYQRIGFSDAAELFVFLSGISCGIVYSRVLERRGWTGMLTAITKRATLIYAYYLLTSVAIILLINAAATVSSARLVDDPFLALIADPIAAMRAAVLLTSPPALPGILVLYLMLTLVVIPLFFLGVRKSATLALVASAAVWTIAQFDPDLSPHLASQSYFDWLAWQFLFSIGMFIGIKRDAALPVSAATKNWLARAAWVVVISSLGYRVVLLVAPTMHVDLDWLRLSEAAHIHMKENLSIVRLVHFLSVAFLVTTYVKSANPLFASRGAKAIIQTGRYSLEVFCLSAICSVILNIIVVVDRPDVVARILLDFGAIALILLTVWVLTDVRGRHQTRYASKLRPVHN
jgi:hypothetical protein